MRKPRVIIFDDTAFILTMLKRYFSGMNFEVQCLQQPVLCQACENANPCADVIITDLQMPGINGIELLNHHKGLGCSINIENKAIMSAAMPDEHIDRVGELAGTFLQKPFCLEELNAWTRECLRRIDLSKPLGNYYCAAGKSVCNNAAVTQ